jgi:two-component SAPR family response regulator
VLLADSAWVSLNADANVVMDVAEMESAFSTVCEVPGISFDTGTSNMVRDATLLYRGNLLEGWYHDWCLFERERLQTIYLILLDKLMGYFEARGEYESGIVYGHRILQVDRARERTHRNLMRLYALSGDRTSGLRQYDHCFVALRDELDVEPATRTRDLAAQIRADQIPDSLARPISLAAVSSQDYQTSLLDVSMHLTQVRSELSDVAEQLARDIEVVEAYLK